MRNLEKPLYVQPYDFFHHLLNSMILKKESLQYIVK